MARYTKDHAKCEKTEFITHIQIFVPLADEKETGNSGAEGLDEHRAASEWFGTYNEALGWLTDVLTGQHTLSEIMKQPMPALAGIGSASIEQHLWMEDSFLDDEFGMIYDAVPELRRTFYKTIEGVVPNAQITYSEEWSE